MSKLSLILIAALASGGAMTPAFGREADSPPSATVRYDDLNLSTVSGRAELDTRVRRAIKSICTTNSRVTLSERAASLECEAVAKRSVEPQLASLYNGSSARFASEKPPVVAAP